MSRMPLSPLLFVALAASAVTFMNCASEATGGDGGDGGSSSGGKGSGADNTGGSRMGGQGAGENGNAGRGGKGGTGVGGANNQAGSGGSASGGASGGVSAVGGNTPGCTPDLTGVARDFKSSHPDFYFPTRKTMNAPAASFVKADLGTDGKPVYALTGPYVDDAGLKQVEGPESFAQWFRDTEGVNMAFKHKVMLASGPAGLMEFGAETEFFPLDGKGFGNETVTDDLGNSVQWQRNYLLTFELHASFRYEQGKNQTMIIESDDDSWVFVNGKLAIDHGGLHGVSPRSVKLDMEAATLGLQNGNEYAIAIFFADRNPDGSKMRFRTNAPFTNCQPIFK